MSSQTTIWVRLPGTSRWMRCSSRRRGNDDGAGNVGRVVLAVLADVEQRERRAGVEQMLKGGGPDLKHDVVLIGSRGARASERGPE